MLSEDSETGEGMKKRHKGALPEEDEDVESSSGKMKGKNPSWEEHDAAPSFSNEVSALAGDMEPWAKPISFLLCSCWLGLLIFQCLLLAHMGLGAPQERIVCSGGANVGLQRLNLLGRQQSPVPWSQPEHSVLHWL